MNTSVNVPLDLLVQMIEELKYLRAIERNKDRSDDSRVVELGSLIDAGAAVVRGGFSEKS